MRESSSRRSFWVPSSLALLCGLVLLFSASPPCWSQDLPDFATRLDRAIQPLLTLPDPQRGQLIAVLTLYSEEFKLRAKDSEQTQAQLIEQSRLSAVERQAHKAQLDAKDLQLSDAHAKEFRTGVGGVIVGALAVLIAHWAGWLR